ncbi:Pycsar system effector family protein [Streptomyces sp. NPDC058299]|uniref:Pycsar system effector family protein n=1 Tax=Streptomyces sp. NPDC058299 TaxID=3346435 RepID=UPI0036ED82EF
MTTTQPQPVTTSVPGAADAATTLRSELGRVDNKASLLLALTGAALAGLGSAAPQLHLPTAAAVAAGVGSAALVAAVVLLLLAVRPSLPDGTSGWPAWHRITDADLRAYLALGCDIGEVRCLQQVARQKFVRVHQAVNAILVGLAFLVLATVLAVLL